MSTSSACDDDRIPRSFDGLCPYLFATASTVNAFGPNRKSSQASGLGLLQLLGKLFVACRHSVPEQEDELLVEILIVLAREVAMQHLVVVLNDVSWHARLD